MSRPTRGQRRGQSVAQVRKRRMAAAPLPVRTAFCRLDDALHEQSAEDGER